MAVSNLGSNGKGKQHRLTVGCRVRIKTLKEKPAKRGRSVEASESYWRRTDGGHEAILLERTNDYGEYAAFSFISLAKGTKKLKKDSKIIVGGGAWIPEDDMVLVDSDFDANLDFIDWYNNHHNADGEYEGDIDE